MSNMRVRIKNFRSLEDISIELKPLTFLFGANGSGKSSFLKAIRFWRQNLFPFSLFKIKYRIDDNFDLGSFKEVIRNNDTTKNIVFETDFITSRYLSDWPDHEIDYILEPENFSFRSIKKSDFGQIYENKLPNKYRIRLTLEKDNFNTLEIINIDSDIRMIVNSDIATSIWGNDIGIDFQVKKIQLYFPDKNVNDLFTDLSDFFISILDDNTPFSGDDINISMLLRKFISTKLQGQMKWEHYSPKEKKEIYHSLLSIFEDVYKNIPDLIWYQLNAFHYSSTRIPPQHSYAKNLLNQKQGRTTFYDYGKLLNLYMGSESDYKKAMGIMDMISNSLNSMGLAKNMEILDEENQLFFQVHSFQGTTYNLAEGSSGMLQILPILIGIYATDDLSVFIEQPELHLHPKLQASFIEVLSSRNKMRFQPMGPVSYVIETHSEHMIRKVQVMIANGKINRDDVAVYYFDNREGSTKIKEMEIEESGFFKEPWPDGFFDDSYNLSRELIFAQKN